MRTLAIGSNVAGGAAGANSLPSPARARSPTIRGATIVIVPSSSGPELIFERQLPNAFAGRGEDGVGQRSSGDGRARFADAARRFQIAHQVDFDLRRLVDPHDPNVVEV